jgi:hypothetical protein
MVARAAHGLNPSEARQPPAETTKQNPEIPNESEEPFRLVDGDTTEVVGQTFLNYTFDDPKPSAAGRGRKAVRVLLILLLLGGAAAWLQSEPGKSELSKWFGKLSEAVGLRQKVESNTGAPVIARQAVPATPAPGGEFSSPSISASAIGSPHFPDAEKSVKISLIETKKGTGKNSPANDPKRVRKAPPLTSNDPQAPLAQHAGAQRKLLEAKVYKAIENRAIIGVDVAVINGTAVLEGRVATEQQKEAAERAARSVAGVERVHNRITIGS